MKKHLFFFFIALVAIIPSLSSCIDEDEYTDSPSGNFEALWKIIDEHYCFFDYKNVDWNVIHAKYKPQVAGDITTSQLFEVLGNMLGELQDGHVNLYSPTYMHRLTRADTGNGTKTILLTIPTH